MTFRGLDAAAVADLERRYQEPHRRYHTLEHLHDVLAEIERLGGDEEVRLAAWFHDAIYDPVAPAGANEEASAQLAAETLGRLGAPAQLTGEVVRLVRLTAGHQPEHDDRRGQILAAADLAILSAPTERYDRYRRDVRDEYGHLADETWTAGRAAVLRSFLRRNDLDPQARANLERELADLTSA